MGLKVKIMYYYNEISNVYIYWQYANNLVFYLVFYMMIIDLFVQIPKVLLSIGWSSCYLLLISPIITFVFIMTSPIFEWTTTITFTINSAIRIIKMRPCFMLILTSITIFTTTSIFPIVTYWLLGIRICIHTKT